MARKTVEEFIEEVRKLSREEQIQFVHMLIDLIAEQQLINSEDQLYESRSGSDTPLT